LKEGALEAANELMGIIVNTVTATNKNTRAFFKCIDKLFFFMSILPPFCDAKIITWLKKQNNSSLCMC
jgi:hypothetical protein